LARPVPQNRSGIKINARPITDLYFLAGITEPKGFALLISNDPPVLAQPVDSGKIK